jgi:hypothetical protein
VTVDSLVTAYVYQLGTQGLPNDTLNLHPLRRIGHRLHFAMRRGEDFLLGALRDPLQRPLGTINQCYHDFVILRLSSSSGGRGGDG